MPPRIVTKLATLNLVELSPVASCEILDKHIEDYYDWRLKRRSTPNTDELEKVIAAKDRLADLPIHICDATSLTPAKLADAARLLRDQSGIKMLVIDYLQLLDFERRENRNVEVAGVTRAVKTLALEMNVPILLLSQLNRDSTREKRRPRLHDLRDSGAIEQDADVVLFLHDPDGQRIRLGRDILPSQHVTLN